MIVMTDVDWCWHTHHLSDTHTSSDWHTRVCARLAQLVRSLTSNQKVPGSIPGLVEGWTLGDLLSPHRPWTGTLSRWSSLDVLSGDLKEPTHLSIHLLQPLNLEPRSVVCTIPYDKSIIKIKIIVTGFVPWLWVMTLWKIFAVDTQFKQLRKRSLKKIQASAGFEPVTSAIPVQCSTNWAMKPQLLGAGQF